MKTGNREKLKPWRRRWPGKPCMRLELRDAKGSEVAIETTLSPELYGLAEELVSQAIRSAVARSAVKKGKG